MYVNKHKGKIFGATFSKAEKKAMEIEINRQCAEAQMKLSLDLDSMVLYMLASEFGFGKKRLRRAYEALKQGHDDLLQHYQMDEGDGPYLARYKLLQAGVDVEKWYKEIYEDEN